MNDFRQALFELLETLPEACLRRIEFLGQVRDSSCCLLKLQPGWVYADGFGPDLPLFCSSLEEAEWQIRQARRRH